MTSYLLRLLCLCLASFFLVHLAFGLLVRLVATSVRRAALRMEARTAANLLFALRSLPAATAFVVVTCLCAPSYLWLEPAASDEEVGLGCLLAAVLGLAVLGEAVVRGYRAYRRSRRQIDRWERNGYPAERPATRTPVWLVNEDSALVALTGILRPRVLVSEPVIAALSTEQLDAVLQHEEAHRASGDNLKRLLMAAAPATLPLVGGFETLERAWASATEWAADDRVAQRSRRRALALASALVQVARLNSAAAPPLIASLFADGAELSARIERLLHPPLRVARAPQSPILKAAASVTLVAAMAGVMLQPAMFHSVHELLENLIR